MKGYVVIGAGYGDEGKGLITDYLTRTVGAGLVVRFNGGAQAGHTVQLPDGTRHVFSHVGSGTFAGAHTHLGERFIVNPYLLTSEVQKLRALGHQPTLSVSMMAPVTTIYDMAINVAAELARDQRHGSCGLGINETVTRSGDFGLLTVAEVIRMGVPRLAGLLEIIRRKWVPRRLEALGITDLPEAFHLHTGHLLQNNDFYAHAEAMLHGLVNLQVEDIDAHGADVIFEGAQGLALDEELGSFPHVTRSKTGLSYAMEAASDIGVQELQPVYVTRAYATRHGAGPFAHEGEAFGGTVIDPTNKPNEWQGSLRVAPLDLHLLKRNIELDLERATREECAEWVSVVDPVVAVSCLDQLDKVVTIYDLKRERCEVHRSDVTAFIEAHLGYKVVLQSSGPTHKDVVRSTDFGV